MATAAILAGLSGLSGLFGKSKQVSDTTTNTTPVYDPESLNLKNFLIQQFQKGVTDIPAWNKAYETSGLQNILNTSNTGSQFANDVLASRGIDRTTAGSSSLIDSAFQRGKQVSGFLNQAPIAEQANQQTVLNGAGGFLASLPQGSTQTQHTVGTGGPSSPAAGFIGGATQGLAGYLGQQSANDALAKVLKGINPTATSLPEGLSYNVPAAPSYSIFDPKRYTFGGG